MRQTDSGEELTTNAVRHTPGLRRGDRPVSDLIELWMYRRRTEIICVVADAGDGPPADLRRPDRPAPGRHEERGRGLQVVAAVTRCGYAPTRLRTRADVPGTAAWFAVPAPGLADARDVTFPEPGTAGDRVWSLGAELRARGVPQLTLSIGEGQALLRVPVADLVVSCHSGMFRCRRRRCGLTVLGGTFPWSAITPLSEDLVEWYEDARQRPPASLPEPIHAERT